MAEHVAFECENNDVLKTVLDANEDIDQYPKCDAEIKELCKLFLLKLKLVDATNDDKKVNNDCYKPFVFI